MNGAKKLFPLSNNESFDPLINEDCKDDEAFTVKIMCKNIL